MRGMSGPEHYREAERLLEVASRDVSENWPVMTGEHKADLIAAAQVHATLAAAAATIDPAGVAAWSEVLA